MAYGCWRVARPLVARGAKIERLWHAAALGMLSRVRETVEGSAPPRLRTFTFLCPLFRLCVCARNYRWCLVHGQDVAQRPSRRHIQIHACGVLHLVFEP